MSKKKKLKSRKYCLKTVNIKINNIQLNLNICHNYGCIVIQIANPCDAMQLDIVIGQFDIVFHQEDERWMMRYFAVFDGHAGAGAALMAVNLLHHIIRVSRLVSLLRVKKYHLIVDYVVDESKKCFELKTKDRKTNTEQKKMKDGREREGE